MTKRKPGMLASALVAVGFMAISAPSLALSVSIAPLSSDVNAADGSISVELLMDYTGDPTIGGGLDFTFTGPVAFTGFTPSAFFMSLDITGHGTTDADNDYEIHFGDYSGLEGPEVLGALNFDLLGPGTASIDISINSLWGGFYSAATFNPQAVDLNGATANIASAVPLPAAAWLFFTGLGFLRRRDVIRYSIRSA